MSAHPTRAFRHSFFHRLTIVLCDAMQESNFLGLDARAIALYNIANEQGRPSSRYIAVHI